MAKRNRKAAIKAALETKAPIAETVIEQPVAETVVEQKAEATAEATATTEGMPEAPVAIVQQPAIPRRNNFPQFMGKQLHHLGGYVTWPRHVMTTGTYSEQLVRENPGITFEQYIASKGSVSRLCYMVQKGKVKAEAAAVIVPEAAQAEAPAAVEVEQHVQAAE